MKKYEHAKQRKLSLTSIIKNTMLNRDESSQEQSETNGNSVKERVVGCNRKDNGKRENQSGEIARRIGSLRHNINKIMRRKNAVSLDFLVKMAESIGLEVEMKIKQLKI